MPAVLVTHDVYHKDWIRLMTVSSNYFAQTRSGFCSDALGRQDLSLAWSSKLPVPDYARDGRPPKRTTLTADLIDLWNTSFFFKRGVEVVLFKGRERRSGRGAGSVELHLPGFDDILDVSDTDSSVRARLGASPADTLMSTSFRGPPGPPARPSVDYVCTNMPRSDHGRKRRAGPRQRGRE